MKILVISPCTKSKRTRVAPAAQMYSGRQHEDLMEGLGQVRDKYGERIIDLTIISSKYGLLSEWTVIERYNHSFNDLSPSKIIEHSNRLQLHENTKALIACYDLVFFLLGEKYVRALQLPFAVTDSVTQIFLAAASYSDLIRGNVHFIDAGARLEKQLGISRRVLKGALFKRLCEVVCSRGLQVFEAIRRNPQKIVDLMAEKVE